MPSVALAMINPGKVTHETFESFVKILSRKNEAIRPSMILTKRSGALIQIARNEIVREFLSNEDMEWLLWVDSDIEFPPDIINKLLEVYYESGAKVIGGMYIHPMAERMKPSVFYFRSSPQGLTMEALHLDDVKSMINSGTKWVYCDGTGAGCLLVHRDIYQKMLEKAENDNDGEPFFAFRFIQQVFYGEDLFFCYKVRQILNEKIAVRLDVNLGHVKDVIYRPDAPRVL